RLESDVSSVRRPSGTLVIAGILCDLRIYAGCQVMDINVEVCTASLPGECNALSVGRPCSCYGMPAFLNQSADISAVHIHDVNLRAAAPIGSERDFAASARIPYRRSIHGFVNR